MDLQVAREELIIREPRITPTEKKDLAKLLKKLYDRKPLNLKIGKTLGATSDKRSDKDMSYQEEDERYSELNERTSIIIDKDTIMRNIAYRFGEPQQEIKRGTSKSYLLPIKADIGKNKIDLILKGGFKNRQIEEVSRSICASRGLSLIERESLLNIISYSNANEWLVGIYAPNGTLRLELESKDPEIWKAAVDKFMDFLGETSFSPDYVRNINKEDLQNIIDKSSTKQKEIIRLGQ